MDRRAEDANTQRRDGRVEPGRVDAVAIVEDESVGVRCSENLPELLQGPSGGGMHRHVDVHEPAASHFHHDEDVEHPEGRAHCHAEVAGQDGLGMVADKGGPPLPGCSTPFPAAPASHIAVDDARRDPQAELQEQFRGDPFLASDRIATRHSRNQALQIRREAGPSGSGLPAPEEPDGLAVPAEERRGLDERERLAPGKAPGQQDQREPHGIRGASGLHLSLPVQRQLFAPEQVLGRQRGSGTEYRRRERHGVHADPEHDLTQVPAPRDHPHR